MQSLNQKSQRKRKKRLKRPLPILLIIMKNREWIIGKV